jgi:hypothetical protein
VSASNWIAYNEQNVPMQRGDKDPIQQYIRQHPFYYAIDPNGKMHRLDAKHNRLEPVEWQSTEHRRR